MIHPEAAANPAAAAAVHAMTRPTSIPHSSASARFCEQARHKREELMAQARRDIETETRRAIQEIRREVADLTVMATEKVTRKTLTEADQKRLVDEALAELDFTTLAGKEQ